MNVQKGFRDSKGHYVGFSNPADRFCARINYSPGCWEWSGAPDAHGYGIFVLWRDGKERHVVAHRYAFALWVRPLEAGEVVRHRCDNPRCVRPDHLEPGTHADNFRDMVERNTARYARLRKDGTPHVVLTDEQVAEVRSRAAAGEARAAIAASMGTTSRCVGRIVNGTRRAGVPPIVALKVDP